MLFGRFFGREMFLYYQDKATACGGQRSTSERYRLNMEKQSKKD